MIRYAIDVSHHNSPASLPWASMQGRVHAVMARACYGAELRDRSVAEHVRRARTIGALVGLYIFYRPGQPVRKQFELFRSVAEQVDLGSGDVVPALDIEHDPVPAPGTAVSPAWSGPVVELAGMLDEWCGAKCMPYITQREWAMLGKPGWVLDAERPLWVAHNTAAVAPATPAGRPWTMWQHRVGPFVADGPGGYDKAHPLLDQNRITGELPLIGSTPARAFSSVPTEDHEDQEWADLRGRLRAVEDAWEQTEKTS